MTIVAGLVVVAAVAFVTVSYRAFLRPPVDAPRRVDAIVMLGGGGPRGSKAVELLDEGYADVIVFASAYVEEQDVWATTPCNPGANDLSGEVICFDPEPATTQGEVRGIIRLAEQHHWQQILVVASEDQITRGRLLFGRCWGGEAWFAGGVHHPQGALRVFYEWGATLKALTIRRSC
jgi:uncharacterized SAM-binding protein YcdF (DUF218 family)